MNAIPAKIAGVQEIVMVTPPGKDGKPNPDIMAAALVAGVDRVFLVGGAQAVAALAYGTETMPKVEMCIRDSYTGSMTLKIIDDVANCRSLDMLKKGSAILTRGEIEYDKYDREIVCRARCV